MGGLFNLLTSNLDAVFTVLLATHGVALAIVNLTPTPKDNEFVAKVYRGLEIAAGIFTRKVKF